MSNEEACSSSSIFFNGSIPEAISTAQRSSKLFLVYISNDGEESLKLEETWTNSQVTTIVSEKIVAVRLVHGSSDAIRFSALYPVSRVPSITVIGYEGVKLWQHDGYITPEGLSGKLQQAVAIFHLQLQQAAARTMAAMLGMPTIPSAALPNAEESSQMEVVEANTSSEDTKQPGVGTSLNEQAGVDGGIPSQESMKQVENDVAVSDDQAQEAVETRANEQAEVVVGTTSNETAEDEDMMVSQSVSLAAVEPEEDTKLDSADSSEISREQEPAESFERNRTVESQEDSRPLQVTESNEVKECSKKTEGNLEGEKQGRRLLKIPDKILLQVRLTDGGLIRGQFEPSDDLWTVKSFVDANRTDGKTHYSFAVPFPRKIFSADDFEKALVDLNLGSRAALMLVPTSDNKPVIRRSKPASSPTAGGSYVGRWLPYLNPLSYWRGAGDRSPTAPGPQVSSSGNSEGGSSEARSKKTGWGVQSNIHTLKHDEDDMFKKGNAYWNGNSTQFGGDDEDKR